MKGAAATIRLLAYRITIAQTRSSFPGKLDQHPAIDHRGGGSPSSSADRDTIDTKAGWR
jgi:hypothetical protein